MFVRSVGNFLGKVLLAINVLVALLMVLCAFSSYISPYTFPVLSCAGLAFPIFLLLNFLFFAFWLFFNRRYALLPLVVMFVCIGQIRAFLPINISMKQVPDDAIKILSYNVMFYDSHQPHTEESPNEIVRYIQNSNADIVCLQEASFNNSNSKKFLSEKVFRKALSTYPYFSFHKEKGSGWVCLSRFPILSTRSIPYESVGNGTVAYELKVGNDTLLLVNNHLESNKLSIDDRTAYRDMIIDPKEDMVKTTSKMLIGKVADAVSIRASQADSVAKFIQDSKHKYVVVCGDFNDSSLSYAHRVIGKGLNDAFIDTGNGLGVSYNRYGFYFRIDHIMASENLDLFNCTVDNSIKTSDHYPIWCYIKKK
ncbi:MAG: endonuclease/exonuclease/phosphatase family protein [Bacteroidaceae bacterium]|nr:endonuclease/exonuclease/phosphatase family protein [Bacteroidaceae bacterium]